MKPWLLIYPLMVTFTDMDDLKSVTLVYERKFCREAQEPQKECEEGLRYYTKTDRMEEMFGEGVRLKNITFEITDEPLTWGKVDQYLPGEYESEVKKKWRKLPYEERRRLYKLTRFKLGGTK